MSVLAERNMMSDEKIAARSAAADIARMKVENEQLRNALKRIQNCGSVYVSTVIAEAALERSYQTKN